MHNAGIVSKNPQNSYFIVEKYKVKSIKINVLTEYFLLLGRFWPKTIYFVTYLFLSLIIAFILVSLDKIDLLKIYLIVSITINLVVSFIEVRNQLKALPWDE